MFTILSFSVLHVARCPSCCEFRFKRRWLPESRNHILQASSWLAPTADPDRPRFGFGAVLKKGYGLNPFLNMQLLYVSMATPPGSAAVPANIWSRGAAALAWAMHSRIAASRDCLAGAADTAVVVTTTAAHSANEPNHSVRMFLSLSVLAAERGPAAFGPA